MRTVKMTTTEKEQKNMSKPFGFYAPDFTAKLVLALVKTGLGAGRVKSVFAHWWQKKYNTRPVDLVYQGLKFRLYPHDNTIDRKILFSRKLREKKELSYLQDLLDDGGVLLDIGANMGYYTLFGVRFGAGKVIAIEANPVMAARLKENIAFNSFQDTVRVFTVGVGDQKGVMTLTVSDQDMGSSSMVNKDISGKDVEVAIETLPSVLAEAGVEKVDALKIDVEGMEDRVLFPYLRGLPQDSLPKIIIMEDNRKFWKEDVIDWLLSNGYHTACQTNSNLVLKR
jgi:FkbM family methyltransferase